MLRTILAGPAQRRGVVAPAVIRGRYRARGGWLAGTLPDVAAGVREDLPRLFVAIVVSAHGYQVAAGLEAVLVVARFLFGHPRVDQRAADAADDRAGHPARDGPGDRGRERTHGDHRADARDEHRRCPEQQSEDGAGRRTLASRHVVALALAVLLPILPAADDGDVVAVEPPPHELFVGRVGRRRVREVPY